VNRLARLTLRLMVRRLPYAAWPPRMRLRLEREARDVYGMPWTHPENLTRQLPRRTERRLCARAAELWPDDEWMQELLPWQ
jgi:hypothetical protein